MTNEQLIYGHLDTASHKVAELQSLIRDPEALQPCYTLQVACALLEEAQAIQELLQETVNSEAQLPTEHHENANAK